jgi:ribosomal protein S18 acetylase RimI-like enzyme
METCYVDPATRTIADLVAPGELTPGWTITRINVPAPHRGKGHGSTMLKRILADADAKQATLYLEVSPSDGLDYEELFAWYTRHGFKRVRSGYLRRLPRRRPSPDERG